MKANTSIMNAASDEPFSVNIQLTPDEYRAFRANLDNWPDTDEAVLRKELEWMEQRHNARFKDEYNL